MFDPFAGSGKDQHGTILYQVDQEEIDRLNLDNDEAMRQEFSRVKDKGELWEIEDESALDHELLKDLEADNSPFNMGKFNEVISDEIGVFA